MINFIKKHTEIKELYVNNSMINTIIDKFKKEIIKNKDIISEMYNIDKSKSIQTIEVSKIIDLLNSYKNEKIRNNTKKDIIMASYYGTPYITINLCMQALFQRKAIILVTEDKMLAINKILTTIFNTILEEHKIVELVKLYNLPSVEEIKNISNNVETVICIGNSNTYQFYRKSKIDNLKYIPFKNMAIYCENEKYQELQYELYKYAIANNIEVEIYDNIELDEFMECMELDKTIEEVVVFTHSEESKKILEKGLLEKKVFINNNPFKNENFKISI